MALVTLTALFSADQALAKTTRIATLTPGCGPSGVGVNPVTNKIYVSLAPLGAVAVIDGNNNTVLLNIPLGPNLRDVAVNPATNRIYVAEAAAANQVHVIDGSNDTFIASLPVGSNPRWIGVNPTIDRIYVGNESSNSVTTIDGLVLGPTFPVGGVPGGIGVHTGTGNVYVGVATPVHGVEVYTSAGALVTTIGGINSPNAVVVDSGSNLAYVASETASTLTIIDTTSNTIVLPTAAVGANPYGVALNRARNRAYTANGGSTSVSIVNTVTHVIDEPDVQVDLGTADIDYNPTNDLLYVANFSDCTISILSDVGSICEDPGAGQWWNPAWKRRRQLTIDNGAQLGGYDDFPLLVRLDPTRIDYSKTRPGGDDLRFIDSNDFTVLDYEIERWTPGGTSWVWVRVPNIPGTSLDTIYMYFDGPPGAGANPPGVWGPGGYNLVHHLDETAGPHTDSATADGAANDSVVVDVQPPQGDAPGQIDGADQLSFLSTDNIDVADHPVLNAGAAESLTVEAWIRTGGTGDVQHIAAKEVAPGAGWDLTVWFGDQARFTVYDDGVPATATAQAVVVTDNQWHYVVGRWDRGGANVQLFVDGSLVATANQPLLAGSSLANAQPFVIGEEGDADRGYNFDGTIDEVRFAKTVRSDDWIRAQNLSMRDMFVSFGPETGSCNYRSIGIRANYGTAQPVGAGTRVFATQGSRIVTGELGTLWRSANRGRGDVASIEGVPYTVRAVLAEDRLTLVSPYAGGTAGNKSYSIQRQFTDLPGWENCIDGLANGGSCPFPAFTPASANLVADNRGEVGIAFNDSPAPPAADLTSAVTIDGSTTDAVHTITLTADAGNRHRGIAGAGVLLDNGGNPTAAIEVLDDYVTVEALEIQGGGATPWGIQVNNMSSGTGATGASRILLRNNLIHVPGFGIALSDPDVVADVYNNIIHSGTVGLRVGVGALETWTRIRLLNNTVYNFSGSGFDSSVGAGGLPQQMTLINNLMADVAAGGPQNGFVANSFAINTASRNNMATDASATSASPGGGGLTRTLAQIAFVNEAAFNLHIQAGSNAVSNGINLGLILSQDIDDGVRQTPWDIGADESATTAVTLHSFGATGLDSRVELRWQTASELHNLGFHLYRGLSENGPWTRLTASLIPGLGSSAVGQAYSFRDAGLTNDTRYFYRLEDVDASSKTTSHGPVSAVPSPAAPVGDGSGGGTESGRDKKKGSASSSCPDWVLVAYGSLSGASDASASLRCTRHGDPEATSLELLSRDARSATLELRTGGFYALHTHPGAGEPQGTVRVFVPGFDFPQDEKAAALPIRRALIDAVVGRRVQLGGVRALDLARFSLVPSALGKAEMQLGRDGTVRAARRGSRPLARHFPKGELVRLLPSLFQGEQKSAVVEIAPLRFDSQRQQLVLSKRVRVRLLFTGREAGESGRGSLGRAPGSAKPVSGEVLARLFTTGSGLYSVSFEQLFPGRPRGFAASQLRLERQGEPVGYHLEPTPDAFGPGGRLFFFADKTAASTDYSAELAYELVRSRDGLRMPLVAGAPSGDAVRSPATGFASFETNRFYQPGLLDAPDPWLWEAVASGATRVKSFSLTGVDDAALGTAELDVFLQGGSESGQAVDHHVSVSLNGTLLGEAQFAGKKPYRMTLSRPAPLLREDQNDLSLTNIADTGVSSFVFLDRFMLAHPQASLLAGGRFEGTWLESGTVTVSGVGGALAVLDVTPADGSVGSSPRWLIGYEASGGALRFRAEAGRRYLAVSAEALLAPRLATPEPSTLRSAGTQADYLLIAPRAFLAAAEPLLQRRADQGLATRSVAFEEIADQFGHGRPSAEAIRSFLAFAFHSWARPSPRYVLLLGDSTYDPRNFSGTAQPSPLPALWAKTSYLWTVSDPQLAAVNGEDSLPDVAIGRLPATTLEEARMLVDKLLAWEDPGQGLSGQAALVADNPDLAGDFEADVHDIAESYLAGRNPEFLLLRELGSQTRPRILDALNSGLSFLSYVGHGGAAVWASENVWNSWDAASLQAQSQQPLLVTMNCLNGYFVAPSFDSLSESLLKADGRGAIASFSPSGLSLDGPAHQYHRALMAALTSGQHARLGDAILAAQKAYADSGLMPELLGIYHLLGDPAMRLR